ncbi:MAG: hypothetical protein V2I50_12020 [Desulfuromusa sp.]|jgi:hypothetical protein|nr:hypothetical protein [Desulfuromusa sp.]
MKFNIKSWRNRIALVGVIIGLATTAVLGSFALAKNGNPNPKVLPPHAHPFGKSYGEWTAEWWKWHFKLPATKHPAFSLNGDNCDAGQSGKVWFLTGAFTTEVPDNEFNTIVRESCHVPTGKALFFPIINIECSTIEEEPFFLIEEGTDANVETCAASFVDGTNAVVSDLYVEFDDAPLQHLEGYRFQSPVFKFGFDDPTDNILGVDCNQLYCDDLRSVSDGYWIMLPPLSRGQHTIRFTGSFRDPQTNELFFGLDVTYELMVVGGRR